MIRTTTAKKDAEIIKHIQAGKNPKQAAIDSSSHLRRVYRAINRNEVVKKKS